MKLTKVNCPADKIAIKCPYLMKPTRIVVHNTANDASAMAEISYMLGNNNYTSFHYAVDDTEIVQGIAENRNAWHAGDGNGKGNREGIAIEICYSKSGGVRFTKACENAVCLIVDILKRYGWGIDRVTKHQDYSGKYCPHRILDTNWNEFIKMIEKKLYDNSSLISNDVKYQVWDDVRNSWLPNVKNDSDYAGIYGHDVCCVYADVSQGNVYYKVHVKGNKWLSEVKNRTDYAGLYNKPIDAFMIKSDLKNLTYRVHLRRSNRWLPWVTGYSTSDSNNGYAGILGQEIDSIQIK